jgi:hypothetical protein
MRTILASLNLDFFMGLQLLNRKGRLILRGLHIRGADQNLDRDTERLWRFHEWDLRKARMEKDKKREAKLIREFESAKKRSDTIYDELDEMERKVWRKHNLPPFGKPKGK